MGGDDKTLDFYTREAVAYADYASGEKRAELVRRLAGKLPPGGDVMDFGCGSGWGGRLFKELGFETVGFDGSEGLAAEARKRYGLEVTVGRFEELSSVDAFDGIWASFCLLHDSREAMPGHLKRLHTALRQGGAIYVGLKEGEGQHRDSLDMLYTYFSEPEMRGFLADAGFSNVETEIEAGQGYDGAPATSLHIFARRA